MTKKWRLESSSTMVQEFIIEANSEEEARDIWADVKCPSPIAIEHHDEKIDKIKEVKQGVNKNG